MRRRSAAADGGALPADLARGPDPRVWGSGPRGAVVAWRAAGDAWSRAHGLGPLGWLELLPEDVRYVTSALGRAHRRHGLVAPWESDRPGCRGPGVDRRAGS